MGVAMKLRYRMALAVGSLALLAVPACSAREPAVDELPSYDSFDAVRQAVTEQLECEDTPPSPTRVMGDGVQIPTESVKCTTAVEIFYFDSQEARNKAYDTLASAAESDGSVYFAEGRNWFVVDYSEVTVGGDDPQSPDLAGLAEALGARYTEVT